MVQRWRNGRNVIMLSCFCSNSRSCIFEKVLDVQQTKRCNNQESKEYYYFGKLPVLTDERFNYRHLSSWVHFKLGDSNVWVMHLWSVNIWINFPQTLGFVWHEEVIGNPGTYSCMLGYEWCNQKYLIYGWSDREVTRKRKTVKAQEWIFEEHHILSALEDETFPSETENVLWGETSLKQSLSRWNNFVVYQLKQHGQPY